MSNALVDFYRCPEHVVNLLWSTGNQPLDSSALSRFTQSAGLPAKVGTPRDALRMVDDLRLERYARRSGGPTGAVLASEGARGLYYQIRPALPDSLRRNVQRLFLRDWRKLEFPRWPVDTSVEDILEKLLLLAMKNAGVESVPFIWFWPDGASSAAMMTHDVEAPPGLAFVSGLMDIDDEFGIKTSFQIVPEERYTASSGLLKTIRQRQCEVNVHGLDHNGNLFRNRKTFLEKIKRVNQYIQEFQAEGFRSACMYRNLDWYGELDVSYDMSVPNVAHLEPQRGGCCTVFPYCVGQIVELPLTTVQDFSLFHILGDYSIQLWKKQIAQIMERHGLVSFIAHPDYLLTDKSLDVYRRLLAHLSDLRGEKKLWIATPGKINRWWRQRRAMKLVWGDGRWRIEGPGSESAHLGFARTVGDRVVLAVEQDSEARAAAE